MPFIVDFQPIGRRGAFSGENTLLECARELGVDLVSICGGAGSCKRCKVQLISGELSELSFDEELAFTKEEIFLGCRLACKTYPRSDVTIHVPPESLTAPQRTQVEGMDINIIPDPVILSIDVELSPSTLESPRADVKNLGTALFEKGVDLRGLDFLVMQSLPDLLRRNDWRVRAAIRDGEIIAIGSQFTQWLGLAVDIGTSKIAGYLVDLADGEVLASKGMMNPQISYGEDLVSRIVAASKFESGTRKLQRILVDALNEMARGLCEEVGLLTDSIVDAVIVGNTAIHHLFLGLPVKQLGLSPYTPVIDAALEIKAREVGLKIGAGSYVHLLPNIAGYVGADHVAMLLAAKLAKADETTLAIDIGTNTEICLNHQGKMTSVSCASGPAFEGAHIKYGMRAAPGAIEYVRFENDKMELQTIGGVSPAGICGSGLLDAVAQLRLHGILDARGRLRDNPLVRDVGGIKEFILAERPGSTSITVTQKDVRELQLAKAAIRMGILALVENAEIEEGDIQKVIIAGAFGTYIDVKSAITIGMLPDLPLERFEQVGNAAGTGARMALVSRTERVRASELAEKVGYIELARIEDFNKRFAEVTFLP